MATGTPPERTRYTRRRLRYKLNVPLRVIVNRPGKTVVSDGGGLEMSEGGICVLAGTELTLQPCRHRVHVYSSRLTRVRGEVRNRQGYSYRVESMAAKDQEQQVQRLRDILSSATGCC